MWMLTENTITGETPYGKIKEWFETNIDQLPKTLDGETKYYADVKFTVRIWINQVDTIILTDPRGVKNSNQARAAKTNLITIWKDLQYKPGWNLPLAKGKDEANQRRNDRAKV